MTNFNKFLDFIENHKVAIIGTLFLHVGLFVYMQMRTFSQNIYYEKGSHIHTQIIPDEEVIELSSENILMPDEMNNGGPIHNITKNENDSRKTSSQNYSKSSIDKQIENDLRNFEKAAFKEYGADNPTYNNKTYDTKQTPVKSTQKKEVQPHGDGGKTVVKGRTMVSYNMNGRYPHNNNDWYIRNPGYTCESNSNGTVVVNIVINKAGDVLEANINTSASHGATNCMLQKARQYALMSRFAYKSTASETQSGTITYRFVAN